MGALKGRDIVCFSNDWDGDPLSKMHAMKILARENRVLWVNSIGNRRPTVSARDAKRILKKLSGAMKGLRERHPNIWVMTPLAIPFYGSELVRAANGALLRVQVQSAMQQLGFQDVISWSFLPRWAPVSGTLGESLVVYHCVDEFSAFSDAPGEAIRELERRLMVKSDVVICSSEKLHADKVRVNPNAHLVQHGVDLEHFCDVVPPRHPPPRRGEGRSRADHRILGADRGLGRPAAHPPRGGRVFRRKGGAAGELEHRHEAAARRAEHPRPRPQAVRRAAALCEGIRRGADAVQ